MAKLNLGLQLVPIIDLYIETLDIHILSLETLSHFSRTLWFCATLKFNNNNSQ